jgi:oxalate decarboxylase/phosphoglucose isomerase-like protein (cupin superfamily)
MWGGVFCVEPAARTAIHHHGEQHTIAYVLSGSSYVRWGERGEFDATLRAGDFLYVPAWLPHQEINPSKTLPFQWIVVRSTSEPIVVNLPNTFGVRSNAMIKARRFAYYIVVFCLIAFLGYSQSLDSEYVARCVLYREAKPQA